MRKSKIQKIWEDYAKSYAFFNCPTLGKIHNEVGNQVKGGRVLDLGCGVGKIIPHLQEYDSYLGVDISEPMLEQAKSQYESSKNQFQQANIVDLKLEEIFNNIVSVNVVYSLGSVENVKKMLTNAREMLTSNGKLILGILSKKFNPKQLEEIILKECEEQVKDETSAKLFEKFVTTNRYLANSNQKYSPLLFDPENISELLENIGYRNFSKPQYFAKDMAFVISATKN